MKRQIHKEDVLRIVGEIDELLVAKIVETGSSLGELEQAIAELRSDVEAGEQTHESRQPHVQRLRALLGEAFLAEVEDDGGRPEGRA